MPPPGCRPQPSGPQLLQGQSLRLGQPQQQAVSHSGAQKPPVPKVSRQWQQWLTLFWLPMFTFTMLVFELALALTSLLIICKHWHAWVSEREPS